MFRYEGRPGVDVVHLDLYRLTSADELWELGWEELGQEHEIVLVEWPERAAEALPADRWEIQLAFEPEDDSVRRVDVRRVGSPGALPGFPVELTAEPLT
jgi:tRNA A37 threonylcarbamoyladenosine biosynthesis protein TsaE